MVNQDGGGIRGIGIGPSSWVFIGSDQGGERIVSESPDH